MLLIYGLRCEKVRVKQGGSMITKADWLITRIDSLTTKAAQDAAWSLVLYPNYTLKTYDSCIGKCTVV